MAEFRDAAGKRLTDYPRPSVAVDTAVLTVADGALCVVVVADARDGSWRLPGTFVHAGETLADAVQRSLLEKAGVVDVEPKQLHVFDAIDRDPRGWVMSVAHLVAVPAGVLSLGPGAELISVDSVGPLAFDHSEILERAVGGLRTDYAAAPDPWGLLGAPEFTLRDLEAVHRAVDPATPLRDSFRRAMEPVLTATGEIERGTVGKPARLFRYRTTTNESE